MATNQNANTRSFPCKHCLERLVIPALADYAEANMVGTMTFALQACAVVARNLSQLLKTRVKWTRVRKIVSELRIRYIKFRRFCKVPGVSFDGDWNTIEVTEEYIKDHMAQETPEKTSFRLYGFEDFEQLHYIFRKKMFANFPEEPESSYIDPFYFSNSDSEGE